MMWSSIVSLGQHVCMCQCQWQGDREWTWAAIKLDNQGQKDEDGVLSQLEQIPARRSKGLCGVECVCIGGCVLCLYGLHT
jgi:hypothetical protein